MARCACAAVDPRGEFGAPAPSANPSLPSHLHHSGVRHLQSRLSFDFEHAYWNHRTHDDGRYSRRVLYRWFGAMGGDPELPFPESQLEIHKAGQRRRRTNICSTAWVLVD
jgi:hypothetical protein